MSRYPGFMWPTCKVSERTRRSKLSRCSAFRERDRSSKLPLSLLVVFTGGSECLARVKVGFAPRLAVFFKWFDKAVSGFKAPVECKNERRSRVERG